MLYPKTWKIPSKVSEMGYWFKALSRPVFSHESSAYLLPSYFQKCVTVLQNVTWSYRAAVFSVFLFKSDHQPEVDHRLQNSNSKEVEIEKFFFHRVDPSWCRHFCSSRVFQEKSQGTSFRENCQLLINWTPVHVPCSAPVQTVNLDFLVFIVALI